MLIKIIKPGVTDVDSLVDVGAILDYPEKSANSLIKSGYAMAVENSDGNSGNAGADGNNEITPEIAAKRLDKFKVDDLIALATEKGVQYADDAKKADIIAAIVDAEAYIDVLK